MTTLGLALAACLVAPIAMADPPPKDDHHPAADHPAAHVETHRASTVVHRQVTNRVVNVHRNIDVNRTVDVHRNVVVNRTVDEHPAGAPHPARWSRGVQYTGNRVVYNDWGRYHLRQPPPGYAWVQDDNQLVLINLGTGVIDDTFVITVP